MKDDAPAARTAWYTFGDHFHWVDMEWLWGNGVLARSLDDMLAFVERTGAPGNLNFDGIGYEKLASEEPAALARLTAAAADGRVEIVGATYGQPYAQFHGGESAVRQLAYGVRTVLRLVGVRPRAFWEEEFTFFPQLPQLLRDAGYTGASLFFQWTWHTPELPKETLPAVRWRGIDGTEILTLPRSDLNLHQWPEDIEALMASGGIDRFTTPVVQQWLELLPSPDWMCRSEIVAPGIERLLATPGLDFRVGTLSTVLRGVADQAEAREYRMDDVFHGMSVGKNGSRLHRVSRLLEATLLSAESLAVRNGLFGRPYAQWAKYPSWELEEGWRELLAFQHHDNDECEGLCGHVGYLGADRGLGLAEHVLDRNARYLAARTSEAGERVAVNTLGWPRTASVGGRLVEVPAFGAVTADGPEAPPTRVTRERDGAVRLSRGGFSADIDAGTGLLTRVGDVSAGAAGLGGLRWRRGGAFEEFPLTGITLGEEDVTVLRAVQGAVVHVRFSLAPERDGVDISFAGDLGEGPDPRTHAALMTLVEPDIDVVEVRHDTQYAVDVISGRSRRHRKYPTGDWMTSAQEFEEIVDAFTALQFIDLASADGTGLLWLHDGSQSFHRAERGAWNVLSMRDPWDEHYYLSHLDARIRVIPHGPVSDTWRWKAAQEFTRPVLDVEVTERDRTRFGAAGGVARQPAPLVTSTAENVVVSAVFRESDFQGVGFDDHISRVAPGAVQLRLVELDARDAVTTLRFAEPVVAAWRCTVLGEVTESLPVAGGAVELCLRPREIATVAVLLPPAPGDEKTLDEDRGIWATVHRHESES